MKTDRLISIIMILLQQEKITAPELAQRFEVSRRTINRDIEDICKAGIPVVTMQGHNGGIGISDTYKVNKTFFTQEELQMILSGLKGMDSVSKTSYVTKITEKLSSKEACILADDVIVIDLASHYFEPLSEKITQIRDSILARHTISFEYYSQKGEAWRQIEPHRLIFKWSSWYVFGYCLTRKAFRLFKLNRLWHLSTSQDHFVFREIPADESDLDGYFVSENMFHLKALFFKSEKYRLIEEYGADCYSICNDKLLFERDFVNYKNMRQWIFSFGDRVDILEPTELINDRLQQAQRIICQRKKEE